MSYEQFSIHDLNDVGQMGWIYWSRFSIQNKAWGTQVNCECFRLYDISRHSTFKYFEVVSYFTCISVLMLHVYICPSHFFPLLFSQGCHVIKVVFVCHGGKWHWSRLCVYRFSRLLTWIAGKHQACPLIHTAGLPILVVRPTQSIAKYTQSIMQKRPHSVLPVI